MKKAMMLAFCILFAAQGWLHADWVPASNGLAELDIRTLAVDPKNSDTIYAGSEHALYRTADGGKTWREILSFRSERNLLRCLYIDETGSGGIYVGIGPRVRFSSDGGKRWKTLLKVPGPSQRSVLCVARVKNSVEMLWVGTENGLFLLNTKTGQSQRLENFPQIPVYSVWTGEPSKNPTIAVTSQGIYTISADQVHWEKVLVRHEPEAEGVGESSTLEQFGIEEFFTASQEPRLIYSSASERFYASINRGLWTAGRDASTWEKMDGKSLGGHAVNAIADSSRTFYAATDSGVFQWDTAAKMFREITQGLETRQVSAIFYSRSGDYLLAGTKKGLFKYSHPEINLGGVPAERPQGAEDFLSQFQSEPAVGEVQHAAIQYAECSPEKIEAWRQAASRKAFFPTLSLNTSLNRDQNVDIDRGGTGDPDHFIIGPDEKNFDWSAGLHWDLGDLIWNDAQTSIDTRSKLMVELRNDILSEVTHLYFERRRLQTELALSPASDTALQVEKRLRLEELTSQIDALTGGFFSKSSKYQTHT